MTAVTFDTLKFVKTLQAAGVSAPQAEAFASAVRDSHDAADLATRADMRELKAELKSDIRELKAELKSDMRELELRMTIKLGSMMVVAVAVVAALVKLL